MTPLLRLPGPNRISACGAGPARHTMRGNGNLIQTFSQSLRDLPPLLPVSLPDTPSFAITTSSATNHNKMSETTKARRGACCCKSYCSTQFRSPFPTISQLTTMTYLSGVPDGLCSLVYVFKVNLDLLLSLGLSGRSYKM